MRINSYTDDTTRYYCAEDYRHRVTNHMSLFKQIMVLKVFIKSQFCFCPVIWMFHSKTLNYKRSRLHRKASTIVYTDFQANFDELQYPLQKYSKFALSNIKVFEWTIPANSE